MVDEGDVDGGPGEGLGSMFAHTTELFYCGALGVIVLIVDADGDDDNLGCWDGRGAFKKFHEMIYFGTRIGVQL